MSTSVHPGTSKFVSSAYLNNMLLLYLGHHNSIFVERGFVMH